MNPFNNSILILAAGHQDRWKPDSNIPAVKQLIKIQGETLLERMKRQFGDPVVFTVHEEIKEHFVRCYVPRDNFTTVSTMFSTRAHWREWTTILLGDVIYSRAQVRRLKHQKDPLMFYGDNQEIYCIKFHKSQRERMTKAIIDLIQHKNFEHQYGKLWNLYRLLIGVDFREHYIGDYFTHITDCQDFDTVEEYLNYIK